MKAFGFLKQKLREIYVWRNGFEYFGDGETEVFGDCFELTSWEFEKVHHGHDQE